MYEKILSIIGFFLLIGALIVIILTPGATGYEISIYAAYPWYFWTFLIGCYLTGIIILLTQVLFRDSQSKIWVLGFGIIICATAVLYFLPTLRGYEGVSTGFAQQIGRAQDIVLLHHLPANFSKGENIYPGIHLLLAQISLFTGMKLTIGSQVVTFTYFILFLFSLYVLAMIMGFSKKMSIFTLAITSYPLYSLLSDVPSIYYFIPRDMAFLFFPLALVLFYQICFTTKRNSSLIIMLICLLVITPLQHPEDALFWVVFFIVVIFSSWFYNIFIEKKVIIKSPIGIWESLDFGVFLPVIILLIVLWLHFSYTKGFIDALNSFYLNFTNPEQLYASNQWSQPEINGLGSSILREGGLINFFLKFAMITAHQWFYIIVAIITIGVGLFGIIFKHKMINKIQWLFSCLLIVSGGFTIYSFFKGGLFGGLSRLYTYNLFFCLMLTSVSIYSFLMSHLDRVKTWFLALMGLLVFSVSLGVFNLFCCPENGWMNAQLTAADERGADWFLEYSTPTVLVQDNMYFSSVASTLVGLGGLPVSIGAIPRVPYHFGYDRYMTYGSMSSNDIYIITNEMARLWDPTVYPRGMSSWRWAPDDYQKLYSDTSVNRIYYNGWLDMYYVTSEKNNTLSEK